MPVLRDLYLKRKKGTSTHLPAYSLPIAAHDLRAFDSFWRVFAIAACSISVWW